MTGGLLKNLGQRIQSISLVITFSGILILAATPTQIMFDHYALWIYQHGQEEVLVFRINETIKENSSTIEASQLKIIEIMVDGGPISLNVIESDQVILSYQNISEGVFEGITYPAGMYERYPSMHTYVVNAYWEGNNASIWIAYTRGFIGSAHADVWERIPTPLFYPLILTGIVLLIIGAISFVGGIIQVVRLSTKPKITLLLSGFLAPRILLLRSAVIDTSFVAIISSFWAFDYRQDTVGNWVLSKMIISAIPLIDSSITGFLFNVEYFLGVSGLLVLSIIVFPDFLLLFGLWMFFNKKINSDVVKLLIVVNLVAIGIIGTIIILLPFFSMIFVPLPLFALVGWYFVSRWNVKNV